MQTKNNRLVDLTQTLEEGIPDWYGCCGFKREEKFLNGICVQSLSTPSGIGTHMDAPAHFIKNALDIASLPIETLIAPGVVIDARDKASPDYFLSVSEIITFEKKYGSLPQASLILLLTGWSQHWPDPDRYRNVNHDGSRGFPGFSLEAAEYLLDKNIVGIGLDTLSPDGSHPDFPVHHAILGQKKYILENLCHLELLPPIGATIMAFPMKIKGGSEAPTRVIAQL